MDFKSSIEGNIVKGEVRLLYNIPNKHNVGSVFLNSFSNYGQKVAQIDAVTGEQRTFSTIKDRSIRCALWLRKEQISSGDVVSVCTHNQLDACIPVLATLFNGAAYNPWHHELTLDSAQYFLRLVEPKIIFSCESAVDILIEASQRENRSVKIIVFGKHPKAKSLAEVMNYQPEEEVKQYNPRTIDNPLDIAIILFSSGTSGLPKAVTHCYNNVIENVYSFILLEPKVALWYSALCWVSGTHLTLKSLLVGTTSILHSGFDVDETYKVLSRFKVEWMFITAQMLAHTHKKNALEKVRPDSLKAFTAGGAKMNPEDFIYFKKHCPNTSLFQLYGLTESGSTATWQTEENDINSIGIVAPNQQLKIVDINTEKALGPNEQGEIVLKPSGLMMGYLKNPVATKETIDKDGWLHTGDLGYYNDKGEIFLTDRLKEVMKYCGHHVAPSEIENLLLTHPAVLEVAVVPVPHDLDCERPMAFVRKVPGAKVTEKELIEMSSKLGKYKMLHGGVQFLDSIPRTASGKVRRLELKNMTKSFANKL